MITKNVLANCILHPV